MEDLIFEIFIFCMFIILGVLLFGLLKFFLKHFRMFISNPSFVVKILSIFICLCFIGINYIFILKLLEYSKIELIFAVFLGALGSHFIFIDSNT